MGSLPGLQAASIPINVRVPQIARPQRGVVRKPSARSEAEEDEWGRFIVFGQSAEDEAEAISNLRIDVFTSSSIARAPHPVCSWEGLVPFAPEDINEDWRIRRRHHLAQINGLDGTYAVQ